MGMVRGVRRAGGSIGVVPKTLLDFLDEEPMPQDWERLLLTIHSANGNLHLVEAEKLRMETILLRAQARLTLHIDEQADRRSREDLEAARLRSDASDRIARSLRLATWVLAGATVALVLATAVLAFRPA
jgi:hypothetical protein